MGKLATRPYFEVWAGPWKGENVSSLVAISQTGVSTAFLLPVSWLSFPACNELLLMAFDHFFELDARSWQGLKADSCAAVEKREASLKSKAGSRQQSRLVAENKLISNQ